MSYHSTEDREIEASMNRITDEEAERLTTSAYERAIEEYRELCPTLFDSVFCNAKKTYGEQLTEYIEKANERIRLGNPLPEFLDPDDFELLQDTLTLPYDLRYNEYCVAGYGDRGNSDMDGFDWYEHWEASEETDLRDAVCDAFYDYCVNAAAVAKMINAPRELRLYLKVIRTLDGACSKRRSDGDYGGLSVEKAKLVCLWVAEAHEALWAQVIVESRLVEWEITPNLWKKRADAICAKAIAKHAKAQPPQATKNTAKPKNPEPPITLGAYAAKFVKKVDINTRQVWLKGLKTPLQCPATAEAPWQYLRRMLVSTDSEGWIPLDSYEATSWRPAFSRYGADASTPQAKALRKILQHIAGKNKRGEKGKVYIHLVHR